MTQTILIIDDEENIRRMMRLTLEAADYVVGEAASGQEGLDLYASNSGWDVVLLDQRMPGMDGLETLRRLRQHDRDARVIMITAYASVELAVDAMKLGATDFVRKPMTPEILRGAVTAALSKSARRSAAAFDAITTPEPAAQIETVTLNGFEILQPNAPPARADERLFTVLNPEGERSQVLVTIDPEAVGYVQRITRRNLPPENSFWTYAAERLLSDYLWNQGRNPPAGKLVLKEIQREQLIMAERWTE